ncbi:MAG: tetratricopeptide repeat protein [Acidobacteria bacterium]|nr:tetratricopeptide repeat protein [Acidobacteriota bacterium]
MGSLVRPPRRGRQSGIRQTPSRSDRPDNDLDLDRSGIFEAPELPDACTDAAGPRQTRARGRGFTASIALKKTTATHSSNARKTYRKLRKFALAFADYDALAALPDDFETKYPKQRVPLGRADGYRESGDLPRAVAEYTKILAANPDDAGALYGRGLAHYYNKNRTAAAADFEKLVATSWDKEGMKKEPAARHRAVQRAVSPILAGRGRAEEIARTVDAMIGEVAEVAQKGDTKLRKQSWQRRLLKRTAPSRPIEHRAKAHEARGGVLW